MRLTCHAWLIHIATTLHVAMMAALFTLESPDHRAVRIAGQFSADRAAATSELAVNLRLTHAGHSHGGDRIAFGCGKLCVGHRRRRWF